MGKMVGNTNDGRPLPPATSPARCFRFGRESTLGGRHLDAGLLFELLRCNAGEVSRLVQHSCGQLNKAVPPRRHSRLHRQDLLAGAQPA
jgi:hypothetical protein